MCGIAGVFGKSVPNQTLAEWRATIRHRGPDGEGQWQDPRGAASLVHSRLAILDVSHAGAQPMVSPCGRYALVFNGEIYNYRELRRTMMSEGVTFHGESDTEVLLALLAREWESAIPRLNGMFAFAIWDMHEQRGLAVSDAMGIKPVYYRVVGGSFFFCSEVQSLRRISCKDSYELNAEAIRDYLLWGSVSEPMSIHKRFHRLRAGHLVRWHRGMREEVPWTSVVVATSERKAPPDPIARTRTALLTSVERHLRSDVPIGIFLSGGIDSTAIVAIAREVLGDQSDIRTFSIGFDDQELDELEPAKRTAEHFGTNHTEWRITESEGTEQLRGYLDALDHPTIDGFNTWCISRLARQNGVKVVLSGLGGDEFFGGYPSFTRIPMLRKLYRRLGMARGLCGLFFRLFPSDAPLRRMSDFLWGEGTWLESYQATRGVFTPTEAARIAKALTGECLCDINWAVPMPDMEDDKDVVSWLEMCLYMRNRLLRDSDVFSMRHGLELRVPFVDAQLIQQLSTIPAKLRLQPGKRLLLDAVPEIPEWIRIRPKQGFAFPFKSWMEGKFGENLRSAQLRSPVKLGSFNRAAAVAALLQVIDQDTPRHLHADATKPATERPNSGDLTESIAYD